MPEDQEKRKTETQGWKTFSIAGELSVSGGYKERLEREAEPEQELSYLSWDSLKLGRKRGWTSFLSICL